MNRQDDVVRPSLGDGLGMIFDSFRQMATLQEPEHRRDVLREEWDGIVVDTACPPDTGHWETGIHRGNSNEGSGGGWTIVEQYRSRELAEQGHSKWVASLRDSPERKLQDIGLYDEGDDA